MTVELALYQPDIPQNTGTLIRLSGCLGMPLHIIHPAGFAITQKTLRRAAMDYAALAEIVQHASFEAFEAWRRSAGRRLVLLTTRARTSAYAANYAAGDILMVGRESAGVPEAVAARADVAVRIPMRPEARSLNVAVAAAMILGEALRQTDGLSGTGESGPRV